MTNCSSDFVQFALHEGALKFGSFTVKSGRNSPYFFNIGLFNHGKSIIRLSNFYAEVLLNSEVSFDMLFGPAYKGIPLVTAVSIALTGFQDRLGNKSIKFAFNRKEEKKYGEKGILIGHPLKGNVVVIDDVVTSGGSIIESIHLIRSHGANPVAVLVAVDRMERYKMVGNILSENSASEEIERTCCIPVVSITSMFDILQAVGRDSVLFKHEKRMMDYLSKYCISQKNLSTY